MDMEKILQMEPVKREVLNLENIGDNFVAEVLVVDGDPLSKKINNFSYDLGPIGDELSGNKYLSLLGVTTDPTGEMWLVERSNLVTSILTDRQASELGVELKKGSRLGVIENPELKKRIFFTVPELDVAQFFPKNVTEAEIAETLKTISENKDKIFGEYLMNGDEYLALGRRIYGVWSRAVQTGELDTLDEEMKELYPNVIPEKNRGSLEALAIFVSTDLQQEETDYPAKNWWKARAVVNMVMEIVDNNSSYDKDFKKVIEIINLISDKSSFYPDQMWTLIAKPLMELYCDKGNYDRQGFIRQVVGDSDSVTSPHLLMGLGDVRKIFDGVAL